MPETVPMNEGLETLKKLYNYSLEGLPNSKPVRVLGDEYLQRYEDVQLASKKFVNSQIRKCTTSGFLTSLGGFITLPIGLSANLASVLYFQIRMIATLAYMGGFDPDSEEVQTMVYIALSGKGASKFLKKAGVKTGMKVSYKMLTNLSRATLMRINRRIGLRFLAKFGSTGMINLGKGIPILGGFIGGTFDYVTTKIVANNAYRMFIE